jgi:Protein of unknown function (DUF4446)
VLDVEVALWMVAVAGGIGLLALITTLVLWLKLRKLRSEQRVLLPDGERVSLVERQAALAREGEHLGRRIDDLRGEVTRLMEHTNVGLHGTLRFQGTVRYDAYADMGGQQSWSMAILNAEHTGAIITSLHARDHARVYLKEVRAGVPDQRLSPEEQQAVATALADPVPTIEPTPEAS